MGRYNDADHKMKDADDHDTMDPPEHMQLSEEPNEKWQTAGSKSWTKRISGKIRETSTPVFHGRITRNKTASCASASSASEAKPRRRSHDNPRDLSEHCEGCARLSDSCEKLLVEKDRQSDSYEKILEDKEASFQAVNTENEEIKKEIDRLRSISEIAGYDEKAQQQLKVLSEEYNQKDERIRTLVSELASTQTYINDLKSENKVCHEHLDDLRERQKKSDKQIEDLKFERDTYNGQLQSIAEEHKEMKQAIDNLGSEITTRDNDVRGLKQEISRFRAGNPAFVPDNKIIADYQYLLSQLNNWTLSNFRKLEPTKLDQVIADLGLDPSTSDAIIACVRENTGRKCLVVNMLVMRCLAKYIFRPFLFGLDETEEIYLKSLESSFLEHCTEKEVQFWRATTLRMVITSKSHKSKVNSSIEKVASELESFLESIFPPPANSPISKHRIEVLRTIITQAVDFSLTLRVQRPMYKFSVPQSGAPFQKGFMESAEPSLDDDSGGSLVGNLTSGRTKAPQDKVRLTIFPLLLKLGNEDGDKYDVKLVIHKGKILKA